MNWKLWKTLNAGISWEVCSWEPGPHDNPNGWRTSVKERSKPIQKTPTPGWVTEGQWYGGLEDAWEDEECPNERPDDKETIAWPKTIFFLNWWGSLTSKWPPRLSVEGKKVGPMNSLPTWWTPKASPTIRTAEPCRDKSDPGIKSREDDATPDGLKHAGTHPTDLLSQPSHEETAAEEWHWKLSSWKIVQE